MSFKKILYATDFSEHARPPFERALELARATGASVTMLHVIEPPVYALSEGALMRPNMMEELQRVAEQAMIEWKGIGHAFAPGVAINTLVSHGTVWDQVVNEAKAGYDLVVVGTHGRTGIKRVVMGSVAERVARHAPCAVLIVRGP
jgi:nucleotide-binding universal stress UspA family protein